MSCKVSPLGSASAIKWALSSVSRQKFWMNCIGVFTMPCCCIGISCLTAGAVIHPFKEKFEEVVRIYGKGNLVTLATKVRAEKELFRSVMNTVNSQVDPQIITEVSLLDLVSNMDPRFGNIYRSTTFTSILRLTHTTRHQEYHQQLWDAYIKNGGNFHVIIYGLMEVLCMDIDPTSSHMENVLNKFIGDTGLRGECMSHKTLAGF